jgi:DNA-binding MarR family transcriptional regulator
MSRGLGRQQRAALAALARLEAEHGEGRSFYVHAVVRATWPGSDAVKALTLRPAGVEKQTNPSRILRQLAQRGLVERQARHGPGAAVRLTAAGRQALPPPA